MPELPRDLAYEDLILIDDLNVALESGTGEVAIEDWCAKVEKLETLLSGDSRRTKGICRHCKGSRMASRWLPWPFGRE